MTRRGWVFQIGLILVCSGAAAIAVNSLGPDPLSCASRPVAVRTINLAGFLDAWHGGNVCVIDVRKPARYALGHVAGARNWPIGRVLETPQPYLKSLPRGNLLILYCQHSGCRDSRRLAAFLIRAGVARDRIRVFEPGWEALAALPEFPKRAGDGRGE